MGGTFERDLKDLPAALREQIRSRYTLLSTLGKGGMAVVFRARQEDLGREVAIKIQRHQQEDGELSQKRALFEAKVLASLTHPNLIRLYEFWPVEEFTCLVCEFIQGQDLERYLALSGPVPIAVTRVVASQVLEGLQFLHGHGIIHRDLKPPNILLEPDPAVAGPGTIKLADFGIALGPARGFQTQAGMVIGTVAYMSPEQLRGSAVDGRSDLYALGIVMHLMLTGRHPFGDCADREMAVRQLKQPPPETFDVPGGLPRWAEVLLRSMLAKDPDQRPASAGDALQMIAAADAPDSGSVTRALRTGPRAAASRKAGARTAGTPASGTGRGARTGAVASASTRAVSGSTRPATALADPASAMPARVLTLGALVASLLILGVAFLAAGWFRGTRGRALAELSLRVEPGAVVVHGVTHGDSVTLGIWSGTPVACPAVDGRFTGTVPIPPDMAKLEAIRVALGHGGRPVLDVSLPNPARPVLVTPGVLRIRLPDGTGRLTGWTARLEGSGNAKPHDVDGEVTGGSCRFTIPDAVKTRNRIKLVSVSARLPAPPGETGLPAAGVGVEIRSRDSLLTRIGLGRDGDLVKQLTSGCPHLQEAQEKEGEHRDPRELFNRVFDPERKHEAESSFPEELKASLHAHFADPEVPVGEKLETHEWLDRLGEIYLWGVECGHPRFPPLEQILRDFFKVTYGPVGPGFDILALDAARIFGLKVPPRSEQDRGAEMGYDMLGWRDGNLMPAEGRPAWVERASDPETMPQFRELSPPPAQPGPGPLRLWLQVWNQRRENPLRLVIPGPGDRPVSVHLWNFADERTCKTPGNSLSWKDAGAASNRITLEIPPGILARSSKATILDSPRNFGLEKRAFEFVCILGYDWSRGPAVPTPVSPGSSPRAP